MHAPDHFLLPREPLTASRARRWLLLGVAALGVAGIFAGLLANTKSGYFYTALVVHVDLSVLVWFLTMACMFMTLAGRGRGWGALADASFYSFAGGTLLIALSAFTGGTAYMSNYVPVIYHPVFFLGLGLLFSGTLGSVANLFIAFRGRQTETLPEYGIYCAALILLYVAGCLWGSHRNLPADMRGQAYYEYLFWDAGHILQFVHTQLMLVCWLWLAGAAGLRLKIRDRIVELFFLFGPLAVSYWVLYTYFKLPDAMSDAHREVFTLMMKHMNALAPLVIGLFIVEAMVAAARAGRGGESESFRVALPPGFAAQQDIPSQIPPPALPQVALFMSIVLFAAGGMLGYLIVGSNVTVPAHYHGSIVGVTLAFMGVAYLLLPAFGYGDVSRSRLALWQPVVYGGGQLCWMAGMAMLGAHGVPRKTPGSADTMGALAAFLKHGGDGLALIGGLLFVFIVLKAVWSKKRSI